MLNKIKKFSSLYFSVLTRAEKKRVYFAMSLMFLSSLLTLASIGALVPFMSMLLAKESYFYSNSPLYLEDKNMLFAIVSIIVIATFVIKNIISWWSLYKQNQVLTDISFSFSRKLYKKYITASFLERLNKKSPDMVRNITVESTIFTGLSVAFASVLTEALSMTAVVSYLIYMNPIFTLCIFLVLLISLGAFLKYTRKMTNKYAVDRTTSWSKMTRAVIQGVGNFKETKLYRNEEIFINEFNKQSYIAQKSNAYLSLFQQSPRFLIESISVSILMVGILILFQIGTPREEIILMCAIMGASATQIMPGLNRFSSSLALVNYYFPSLEIIVGELDNYTHESTQNELNSEQKLLHFRNSISLQKITFSYPSCQPAISNITFNINKGEWVVITGDSGCGKSTLLYIVLGLLQAEMGMILVDGIKIDNQNKTAWQDKMSYVPQENYIYDASIRDNISFYNEAQAENDNFIWEILETVCLKEFVLALDGGLDHILGENGQNLSGGQKQRLGIARALYRNPEILILDEATSALDQDTEENVLQSISKIKNEITVISIAHRKSSISHADREINISKLNQQSSHKNMKSINHVITV